MITEKPVVLWLDEAVIAKMELLMAFDNIATKEEWIAEMVEADWFSMNELKSAGSSTLNEMQNYIGHDFGYAEEK